MIPPEHTFWLALVFVWGAVWGSFLNVVVHRIPLGQSVVRPGSRCGSCSTPIRGYHNIPILSWVLLRGRCASCSQYFSVRYPLVEAALAVLSVALWWQIVSPPGGGSAPPLEQALVVWFFLFFFAFDMAAIALIDLDTMRIPDALSLPAIPAGLVLAGLGAEITGVDLHSSLLGMLIGGGTLLVITYGYFAITGREGMGLGDYRLMAGVGAFLGWKSLLFLLVASALQGIVFFVVMRVTGLYRLLPTLEDDEEGVEAVALGADLVHDTEPEPEAPMELESEGESEDPWRRMAIPFGPFIVLAAFEWLLFEHWLGALFDRFIYLPT